MSEAKQGELITITHEVPKNSQLAKDERELAEAMINEFESFYRQGVILERIKESKSFQDANFTSFNAYMNARQPLGIKKAHAWRLIAAMNIRPLLPELESPMGDSVWTERSVRPLTNKAFAPSDVKRVGKKIATAVRKGETLSDSLVKKICDADRGVEKKKRIKKQIEFSNAALDKNLTKAISTVIGYRVGFEAYYEDAWLEVQESQPHLIKTLITELEALTSFLKE